ncbi:MAG: MopE-related protein [Polyangiales bacterium]
MKLRRRAGMLATLALTACANDGGVIEPGLDAHDAGASIPAADAGADLDRPTGRDAPTVDASARDAAEGDARGGVRELCNNGLDDDDNGLVDDGCPCVPGTSQQCYPRERAEAGRAPCAWGVQGCEGDGEFGTWTECVGAVTPVEEICGDGVDQDCTGVADDGPRCACVPGQTRPCYEGPRGTLGVGICRLGEQTCAPDGHSWGTCLDQVLPRDEICSNRVDDDCDGVVDNGPNCACAPNATRMCYPGPAAEIGRGPCRSGIQRCNVGGTAWGACEGAVGPTGEVCGNGLDDDCDGSADEECPMTRICMVSVNLNGDCVTTRCPADCPYPVGCDITMAGGDPRGCVASTPRSPVVYFQEGDVCGAGRVTGTLRCSNVPGGGLNASNCPINKPQRIYPASRSGCPAT